MWCTPEHLGTKRMSKAVTVAHFSEDRASPVRAQLALRAWMLMRVAEGGHFLKAHKSREMWCQAELASLRNDIVALHVQGGGTGNAHADGLIQRWCPSAMT